MWRYLLACRAQALLLVGLAAFLRLHNLNWNSLNSDESYSLFFTIRPLPQILADSFALRGDPHPPVYYLVFKPWLALAGVSEVALRLPSVFAGLITVALIFKLGRQLSSRCAGLAAGLFAALGAFWIWNSQDGRMYMFGGTLALAGVVCLVNGLRHGGLRWWVGYFVFASLACYTHIAGSFLLPFQGLLILVGAPRFRRTWWRGLLTLAAIGLAYVPYALNAWRASAVQSLTRHTPPYGQLLFTVTLRLSANEAPLTSAGQWMVVGFVGAVFVVGLLPGRAARNAPRWFGGILTLLFYLVPLAVISILSLRQSVFEPRALMFLSAALALGVGAGWARLWEWRRAAGALAALGLVGIQLSGLGYLWRLGYQKEDWRHAAQYVAEHIGPDDVVVVHLAYYRVPFLYYFHGRNVVATPFGSQIHDLEEVGRGLQPLTSYHAVWLVQSGEFLTDPNHLVLNWLAARYPLATEQFPHSISVRQFVVHPQLSVLPPAAQPLDVMFGQGAHLAGYDVDARRLKATEDWLHPPSNWIHVRLYWSVAHMLSEEATVQMTVEDEPGNVWGSNLERPDGMRTFFPMTTWTPGVVMRDDLDLNLNPAAPPGEYKLVLRLFAVDGAALAVTFPAAGEDYLILQSVEILP